MDKFKKALNLKALKISLSLLGALILFNTLIFYIIFTKGKFYYHDLVLNSLEKNAKILSKSLNTDLYEKLLTSKKAIDGDALYDSNVFLLREIHHFLKKDIRYIYTTYQDPVSKKIYFGIDTALKVDADNDGVIDHSDFKSEYDQAPEILKNAYNHKTQTTSKDPYCDKWGCFVGTFLPLYNSNNQFLGFLGVEIEYNNFQNILATFKNMLIVMYIILTIFAGLIAILIYRQQKKILVFIQTESETKLELDHKESLLIQESKLAEIGKLMAGITHEINNYLTIIQMAATFGKNQIKSKGNKNTLENHEENYNKILSNSKKTIDVIHSMKTLVKNTSEEVKTKVYVKSIIEEVMKVLHIKAKNIQATLDFNDIKEQYINCRQTQLEQVFLNLLSNSLDAIENLEQKWINISFREDDFFDYIYITDSGTGIPDDLLKKIEQGFFTTKKEGKGSGMGIMISKKIIENHGGTLYIDKNSPNTCFVLKLPKNTENSLEQK